MSQKRGFQSPLSTDMDEIQQRSVCIALHCLHLHCSRPCTEFSGDITYMYFCSNLRNNVALKWASTSERMDEMNFWNLNFVVVAYNRSHFGITEKRSICSAWSCPWSNGIYQCIPCSNGSLLSFIRSVDIWENDSWKSLFCTHTKWRPCQWRTAVKTRSFSCVLELSMHQSGSNWIDSWKTDLCWISSISVDNGDWKPLFWLIVTIADGHALA